jgi:hypothetical protein
MSKFKENDRVVLDYDKGTVIMTKQDGSKAIIQWDSDGEEEEYDTITFFGKGQGRIITNQI